MRRQARVDVEGLDEAALVRLVQAGDGEAFRVLMQRGNQRLFRIARAILRDEAEAEDALQEAYAKAYAAIGGFRGDAGVMTWLTRILINEARSRLRRRRPVEAIEAVERAQEGGEVIPFPGASPEADAARAQIRRLIEQAVDALPEGFRTVFVLRDIEGCGVEETALALDLNPDTVKTRLHRARRRLREALETETASLLGEAFPFLGERCARITAAVLQRLQRELRPGAA
ncbi:MAG TPA: RNA polymerase sigma factor [Caulobacter sp.]|nr:RNA polymerase sigma factor [Caulobacter sp.]